jgi:hypothetical protein
MGATQFRFLIEVPVLQPVEDLLQGYQDLFDLPASVPGDRVRDWQTDGDGK